MKKNEKKKKLNIKVFIIILVLTCIVLYTFSKYIVQVDNKHIQTSENFYFNSNILSEEEKIYKLYDWDGTSEYLLAIDLKNYDDTIRYTNKDINYVIVATSNDADISIENENGTIIGNSMNAVTSILRINPKKKINANNYIEVNIEAKSSIPYEKNLKATVQLYVKENKKYISNLENFSDDAILGITTLDINGGITIEYDSNKVYLDTTDEIFAGQTINKNGNKYIVVTNTLQNNMNYTIDFIKKSGTDLVLGTDIIVK